MGPFLVFVLISFVDLLHQGAVLFVNIMCREVLSMTAVFRDSGRGGGRRRRRCREEEIEGGTEEEVEEGGGGRRRRV